MSKSRSISLDRLSRVLLAASIVSLQSIGIFPGSAQATAHVRIMAANISSGNGQSYDPGEGIRIFKGLKPDIVLIQEFNYKHNSGGEIRQFVDDTFGSGFKYYRQKDDFHIPNGVISRYPILESGTWDDDLTNDRDPVYARIDLPGSKDLWAVSCHLLTKNPTVRNREAQQLVAFIKDKVPPGDYLVLGGDFNTATSKEKALKTLQAVTTQTEPATDQKGKAGTNANRRKPYDWVLVNNELESKEVPIVIAGKQQHNGALVFDSRNYSPLDDVTPVEKGDSGADNMQHMAVIRDFELSGAD